MFQGRQAGKVCQRVAGIGTKHEGKGFCDYHEWEANHKVDGKLARSSQMNVARNVVYSRLKFFGEPIDIGPHEALMQEVQRSAGIVAFLEQHLADLAEDGTPKSQILAQATKLGVVPSVWMELFMSERRHLVQVSATAIKAGVAERKVKIAEQQAQLIAMMVMAMIHDEELGLSPEQLMKAPLIARKHLLSLQSGPLTGSETPVEDAIDASYTEAT